MIDKGIPRISANTKSRFIKPETQFRYLGGKLYRNILTNACIAAKSL
jgi:hypothetical protein